jgi:YHS domain-containing protein
MSGNHPERVIDPVCGMAVDVAVAEAEGLTTEHEGRTYAFCSAGCLRAFHEDPAAYATTAETAGTLTMVATGAATPLVIDDGMRRWYESCSCCLSDAYPEIKVALDAERAANAAEAVGPGICEVADAHQDAGDPLPVNVT